MLRRSLADNHKAARFQHHSRGPGGGPQLPIGSAHFGLAAVGAANGPSRWPEFGHHLHLVVVRRGFAQGDLKSLGLLDPAAAPTAVASR